MTGRSRWLQRAGGGFGALGAYNGKWLGAAFDLFLIIALAWLTITLYLSGWGADWPLNSDGVMPYVLFDDLFVHGARASAWVYPVAPYWFPDQALAWSIYAATSDLFRSVFLYAAVQYALCLLAARWVLMELDPALGRRMWWVWSALWSVMAMAGAFHPGGWYASVHGYIFYPYIHSGTLVATLVALGLLLSGYRKGSNASLMVLALLSFAMIVSDQVFIVWFIAPAIVALALPGTPKPRWRWSCIGMLIMVFAIYKLAHKLVNGPFFGAGGADMSTGYRLDIIAATAGRMWRDVVHLAQTDLVFAIYEFTALVAAGIMLVSVFRSKRSVEPGRRIFAVFLMLSIVMPICASIATGRHGDAGHFRYCQTIGLASFALVLLAHPVVFRLGRLTMAVPFLVLTLLAVACGREGNGGLGGLRIHDSHAQQVACEKDVFAKYGVKTGYAEYWRAMSVMARVPGLNIVPLFTEQALPHTGLNMNFDWLEADRSLRFGTFEFVDEGNLDPAKLDILFGAPDERVPCPESAIRLYRVQQGKKGLLTRFYEQYPKIIFRRLGHTGSTDVPAATWFVAPGFADGDATSIRGDFSDWTPFLSTMIDIVPGNIHLWIDYRVNGDEASGDGVAYEVQRLNAYDMPVGTLAQGFFSTEAGEHRASILDTTLGVETSAIGLVLKAHGSTDVTVHAVGWSE